MELDLFFVRENALDKDIQVFHMSSSEQRADILTKALSPSQFCDLRSKLSLGDCTASSPAEFAGGIRVYMIEKHNLVKTSVSIFYFCLLYWAWPTFLFLDWTFTVPEGPTILSYIYTHVYLLFSVVK